MSAVIKVIPVILIFAGILYVKWRLSPPQEVIGSYLEDTPARTRKMLRDATDQRYRETWSRSDPN